MSIQISAAILKNFWSNFFSKQTRWDPVQKKVLLFWFSIHRLGGHTRKSGATEIIFKIKKYNFFYFKKLRVVLAELKSLRFGQSDNGFLQRWTTAHSAC